MTTPSLSKFKLFFEDLPKRVRVPALPIIDWLTVASYVKRFYIWSLSCLKKAISFIYRKAQASKKRKHWTLTINITLTRVVVLLLIGWTIWPHSSPSIAAPATPVMVRHIAPEPHTLPQTPLQPQAEESPIPVAASIPDSGPVANCGDNSYAHDIYMNESGCNTTRMNSIGCIGIGQSCPGSVIVAACPNLDYACENVFYTNYANAYGGWAAADTFWHCIGSCYSARTNTTINKVATWW